MFHLRLMRKFRRKFRAYGFFMPKLPNRKYFIDWEE